MERPYMRFLVLVVAATEAVGEAIVSEEVVMHE